MANISNNVPTPQVLSVNVNESPVTEHNTVNDKKAQTNKNNEQLAENAKPSVNEQVAAKGIASLVGADGVALPKSTLPLADQAALMFQPLQASELAPNNSPEVMSKFALTFGAMDIGKPSGVDIGNPLKNWQPPFKGGAVAPSVIFSPQTFVAALEVAASPQPKSARNPQLLVKHERAEALVKMLGTQESVIAKANFANLTPAQQTAVLQLAGRLSPNDLREELNRNIDASEVRTASRMIAASGLTRDQRIEGLLDGNADGQALLGDADEQALLDGSLAGSDAVSTRLTSGEVTELESLGEALTASHEARALAAGEVVVPSPFLVKLEQAFASGLPLELAGMDIMALAQMIMAQIGQAAEQDLRDVMKEMQEGNRKNDQLRAQMQHQREMQTQIDSKLNDRYHQRTSLDPKNPLYINPDLVTFDRYKALQKIEVTGSENLPQYDLSPNEPRFPRNQEEVVDSEGVTITQRDVDLANMAGIAPQQMAYLRRVYNDPVSKDAWYSKYTDFEEFLAVEVGLTTPAPSGVNQNALVQDWRNANDPVAIKRAMADKFDISSSELDRLLGHWENNVPAAERGASFDAWLGSKLGLVAGDGPGNRERILDFDAEILAADAAKAASQEERALIRDFGVSAADIALAKEYLAIVNDRPATAEDVRAFFTSAKSAPGTGGVGMRTGNANHASNRAAFAEWSSSMRAEYSTSATGPNFPGGAATLEEAVANVTLTTEQIASGQPGRDALIVAAQAKVDAYLATIPTEKRNEVAAKMREHVRAYVSLLQEGKTSEAKALNDGLMAWVKTQEPADIREKFANYITMQLAAAGNEIRHVAIHGGSNKLPAGSYLYATRALYWDSDGTNNNEELRSYNGSKFKKANGVAAFDATQLSLSDWQRTAAEVAKKPGGSNDLRTLFQSSVRDASGNILSTPQTDADLKASIAAILDDITPASLRTQVDTRVKQYTAQLILNIDGGRGDAAAFEQLTRQLKDFINAIRPESKRDQVAGYVAMRMAQVSNELKQIHGNESYKTGDDFIYKSGALIHDARVPGFRNFVPGSGYGDWLDSNEALAGHQRFSALADEWAGISEGYGNPDEDRRRGRFGSLFGRRDSGPQGFTHTSLLASARTLGAGIINLMPVTLTPSAAAPEATETAVDPAKLAAAEGFRKEVDHSTAQGERIVAKEITFAQMDANLDALKDKKDSQSSLSEMVSMRLQMYMDRRQKIMETMSNMFKKSADTQAGIISNMK